MIRLQLLRTGKLYGQNKRYPLKVPWTGVNFSDQTTRGLPTVETGLEYPYLKAHTKAVERLLGESFVPTQDKSYIEDDQ